MPDDNQYTQPGAGFQQPYQAPYRQQAQPGPQAAYQAQPQGAPQYAPQYAASQQPAYAAAPYAPTPAYAPAPAPESKKRGKGWIVAIVVVVCLFLFTAFCVKTCADSIDRFSANSSGVAGTKDLAKDTIGIVDMSGTIQYDGTVCSPEGLKELLDEAQKSEHVKAIVLRVNSGGGTATAGEEMAEYLRQFDKPVVVSSASINASAAYEISAQADYIYVAKSTEIGAIGTVMQLTDLSGLFEKLGIKMDVIASADSKDSSYGYRPLTDEERAYYQKMVDQINDMFVENVATGRKMEVDAVRKLATGLVFTGVDAVENGLADAVGTREDAVAKAAELAGVTDYDTSDLYLSSYDISGLSDLLGKSGISPEELIDALKSKESQTPKM